MLFKTGFSYIPIQISSSTIYVTHESVQHCQQFAVIPFHIILPLIFIVTCLYLHSWFTVWFLLVCFGWYQCPLTRQYALPIRGCLIPYASYTRALGGHHDARVLLLSLIIRSMVVMMQNSLLQVILLPAEITQHGSEI